MAYTALRERIRQYQPVNMQETQDQKLILQYMGQFDDLLTRDNFMAHFTTSAWVVNKARTHVLMAYHNIYDSWAWTGGHADGEEDLLAVAEKEALEETGLSAVTPLSPQPVSLEILCVQGHVKRGEYVSCHLHLNLTYLFEADDTLPIHQKADENSAVKWVPIEEATALSSEPEMKKIYEKLNSAVRLNFPPETE